MERQSDQTRNFFLTVSEEFQGNRFARFYINNVFAGHIMIENYKIYPVLYLELSVFSLQFTKVMDMICIKLCVFY